MERPKYHLPLPTKPSTGGPMIGVIQINIHRSETATKVLMYKLNKGMIHIMKYKNHGPFGKM